MITPPLKALAALGALSLATFTHITAEVLPIGLLVPIADDLDTSQAAIGRLVTGYALVVVLASVPLAHVTRRIPRRHLLSGVLAVQVMSLLATAASTGYWVLLAARAATALGHAVFWSVVAAATAGLFPPSVRGRVLAVLFAGTSLAAVLGVPAGTWIGQQAGWRSAFVALAGLSLVALLVVAVTLPTTPPGQSHSAVGAAPDRRRYRLLVVTMTLAISGTFTSYTYITPFLTEVSAFSAAAIAPLLLARGLSGLAGVGLGGWFADRRPWASVVTPIGVQAGALLGLYVLGTLPAVAAGLLMVSGLAMSALSTTVQNRVLEVAPGSVDVASAGMSAAFNVGIMSGAFIGSVLLPAGGVRGTALAGGLLLLAALAVLLAEPPATRRRPAPAHPPDPARAA